MEITYASEKEELPRTLKEYPIGTFAQLSCNAGLELADDNSELVCNEDGNWDGQMGRCERVEEVTDEEEPKTTTSITTTLHRSTLPETPNPRTTTLRVELTTEREKILLPNITEQFWVELRNYLFHGCQAMTYQSVLCTVTKRSQFSDLSHSSPRVANEDDVKMILQRIANDPALEFMTVDTIYTDLTKGNAIPEDALRQFLAFSIDTIVWNFSNLEDYLGAGDHETIILLIKIVTPLFNNFQLKNNYEELFTIANITEIVTELPTTTTKKICLSSELPQFSNVVGEVVDGVVVYKCQESYKMKGEFVVHCGDSGNWEVMKSGSCQRQCGNLQMSVLMRPQSMRI